MKASELRIGNIIRFDNLLGDSRDVVVAGRFFFAGMERGDWEVNNYYQPIPLTEEWLKRLSFERVPPRSGIASSFIKNWIRIDISNSGNAYYKRIPVPYVHRLQNLYFALRDAELTLKDE